MPEKLVLSPLSPFPCIVDLGTNRAENKVVEVITSEKWSQKGREEKREEEKSYVSR